jgi:adenylate kinase family enzyme
VILDGYPSTKDHCDYLADLVRKAILPAPSVIQLEVPDKVVFERTQKVPGESRQSVEQRLKDYHREMDQMKLYFPNADVTHVDGTKSIKDVESEVARILKERYGPGAAHRP